MASNDSEAIIIDDSLENIEEDINQPNEDESEVTSVANNSDLEVDDDGENGDDRIPFEFTCGMRANSKLIYTTTEKQLYRKDKKRGEHMYYFRCNIVGCPVRLHYNEQLNICTRKSTGEHTHGDQEKVAKVAKLRKSIINECSQMAGSSKRNKNSVSDVIYSNIRKTDLQVDLSKMARSCYRYKSADLPATVTTAAALKTAFEKDDIMSRFGRGLCRENEVPTDYYRGSHVGEHFSYAVFASQRIIDKLPKIDVKRRKYLIDATFKVCPYGEFTQLLVIHIEYLEATTPFIFVLMTRKTEECYTHVFDFIDTKVFSLNCSSFMTDYEVAMRNALRTCYPDPDTSFLACWFHFCQACKRHASQINGFVVNMRANETAVNIYCRFLCLPLLPAANIETAFRNLATEAAECDARLFRIFIRYFEAQWIRKEGAVNISVYGQASRTTNAVEAYNGVLGRKIMKKGHFFKFMEELQEQEFNKQDDFDNLLKSGGASSRSKRTRPRDVKIKDATAKLRQQTINSDEFLRRVVYQSSDVCNVLLAFDTVGVNDDEVIEGLAPSPEPSREPSREPSPQPGPSRSQSDPAIASAFCRVCMDKNKSVVLQPCGHFALCAALDKPEINQIIVVKSEPIEDESEAAIIPNTRNLASHLQHSSNEDRLCDIELEPSEHVCSPPVQNERIGAKLQSLYDKSEVNQRPSDCDDLLSYIKIEPTAIENSWHDQSDPSTQ